MGHGLRHQPRAPMVTSWTLLHDPLSPNPVFILHSWVALRRDQAKHVRPINWNRHSTPNSLRQFQNTEIDTKRLIHLQTYFTAQVFQLSWMSLITLGCLSVSRSCMGNEEQILTLFCFPPPPTYRAHRQRFCQHLSPSYLHQLLCHDLTLDLSCLIGDLLESEFDSEMRFQRWRLNFMHCRNTR